MSEEDPATDESRIRQLWQAPKALAIAIRIACARAFAAGGITGTPFLLVLSVII